jgi:large subunit ribosomal protein L22
MVERVRARFVRISPRKVRPVIDLIRGKTVDKALSILAFTPKRAAGILIRILNSAVANVKQAKSGIDVDELYIKEIFCDKGPTKTFRRWRPRARGRATRIIKGVSHITLVLNERE